MPDTIQKADSCSDCLSVNRSAPIVSRFAKTHGICMRWLLLVKLGRSVCRLFGKEAPGRMLLPANSSCVNVGGVCERVWFLEASSFE